MSDSPPPWFYQAQICRYKAEIAFHTGREDGDIRAIGAAIKALSDGERPVCSRCLKWLPKHRDWCSIAKAYQLLNELPSNEPFEIQTSGPIKKSESMQKPASETAAPEPKVIPHSTVAQTPVTAMPARSQTLPLPLPYPHKSK
jgi:hypothetical protein